MREITLYGNNHTKMNSVTLENMIHGYHSISLHFFEKNNTYILVKIFYRIFSRINNDENIYVKIHRLLIMIAIRKFGYGTGKPYVLCKTCVIDRLSGKLSYN